MKPRGCRAEGISARPSWGRIRGWCGLQRAWLLGEVGRQGLGRWRTGGPRGHPCARARSFAGSGGMQAGRAGPQLNAFHEIRGLCEESLVGGRPLSSSSPQSSWAPAGKNRPAVPGCMSLFEQPEQPAEQPAVSPEFLPVRAAGPLRENKFLLGFLSRALKL